MPLRFPAILTFLLTVSFLVGCQAIPAITPPPGTPPPDTPAPALAAPALDEQSNDWSAFINDACKSYMDVDLQQAYQRFEYPIFWTFHTNFLQPFPDNSPEIRLGCLRFYWRDNSTTGPTSHSFVGTLLSAQVIECVSVNGIVETQVMTTNIPSSSDWRDADDPSLPHRRTTFSADGHVECPLNLTQSLVDVTDRPEFADELALLSLPQDQDDVIDALQEMQMEQAHQYGEFMMAAALESDPELPLETNSILFYEPDLGAPLESTTTFTYEVELALVHDEQSSILDVYATRLGGWPTDSSVSNDGAECVGRAGQFYLWESFGQCEHGDSDDCTLPEHVKFLQFLSWHPEISSTQCRIKWNLIDIDVVPFWAGPATLYIGYNPLTGESITQPLMIFEIWLDPDSSVKPSG